MNSTTTGMIVGGRPHNRNPEDVTKGIGALLEKQKKVIAPQIQLHENKLMYQYYFYLISNH